MGQVNSFLRRVDTINEWIGEKSSYLILFMIASILYETFVRYLFNSPTVWVHETGSFIFGVSLMLGGGYTFLHRGHVNVDIVHNLFSPRRKAILDVMSSILLFSFASVLIWKGGDFAWNSLCSFESSPTVWAPPIYPIKLSIPFGGALLFLQGLSKLIKDITIAIKGGEPA